MPYTDIFKAEERLLKSRKEKPEDWMMSQEQIQQNQEAAGEAAEAEGQMDQEAQAQEAQTQQTQEQMDQAKIAEMDAKMATEPGVQSPESAL